MITANQANGNVHIGGIYLDPSVSQRVYNHSPDGFAWGYAGSGPSQLALALLLFFTGNSPWSEAHYQHLKFEIIAKWDKDANVKMPNKVITNWIKLRGGPLAREHME